MDKISQIQGRIEQIESLFKPPEKQNDVSFDQMLNQAQSTMRIDTGSMQQNMGQVMAPGMTFMPGVSSSPSGGKMTGFINPVPSGKLSPYSGDDGLDIHCPVGTPVMAAKDGVVVYNDPSGHSAEEGPGNTTGAIRIRHADGTETWYAHLSARNENIKPGMFIKAGTVIGQSGTANNVPHLHMSIFYSSGGDGGGFMDPFEMAKMYQQGSGSYANGGQMPGMNQMAMNPMGVNPMGVNPMYGMNQMGNTYGMNQMMPQMPGMNQMGQQMPGINQVGMNSAPNMNNIMDMQLDKSMSFDKDEEEEGTSQESAF